MLDVQGNDTRKNITVWGIKAESVFCTSKLHMSMDLVTGSKDKVYNKPQVWIDNGSALTTRSDGAVPGIIE